MSVPEFFMGRKTLFWSLCALIIFAGIYSFLVMPKLEDPAIPIKQAMVIVPSPGTSVKDMESDVAILMEDALRSLPGVGKISTQCQSGLVMITVEFKMSVRESEIEQHFDLLRRKVNDAKGMLPQGCYDPIVIDDMSDVYGVFYSMTGDGFSYREMYDYASEVRRKLLSVPGVKRVTIAGMRDEVINIDLSKEQVDRNGLLPAQVMMALQNVSKSGNAGNADFGDERWKIYVEGVEADEQVIRDMYVRTSSGASIKLGNIADVHREYSEPQTGGFFDNGEPALAICLSMEKDAVVPDVGRLVDKCMDDIMRDMPLGIEVRKVFFQPDKVSAAISSFMVNLLESVLIVILVLVLFVGLRSSLIVGFGLLLTVALSFPLLLVLGSTLQRISLGAFIVAMGMLVDNAVVIMDGIIVDRKRGLPKSQYLFRVGKNTALPLLGATIIAAATFLSVYLSPDTAGEYAGDLFLVLCVSLLCSWVLALVQIPFCANVWLPDKDSGDSSGYEENRIQRLFRRIVDTVISHKSASICTAVVLIAVCALGIPKVKMLFFPDFNYNQCVVECFLPSEASPEKVKSDLLGMSALLAKNPEVENVSASMGAPPARYCLVRPMTNGGDCYGELIVDFKDYNTMKRLTGKIRNELREAYPDAYIRFRRYNFSISSSHTVEVEFTGPDENVLKSLAKQAEDIMRTCPYVDQYSIQDNWGPVSKTLVAQYAMDKALRSGVSASDLSNSILAAGDGTVVGVVPDGDRRMLVNLRVRDGEGQSLEDICATPVWSMLNVHIENVDAADIVAGIIPSDEDLMRSSDIRAVTDSVTLGSECPKILRTDGIRAIEAECDPDSDNPHATPDAVRNYIKKAVAGIELPEGYRMQWIGDTKLMAEAIGNILKLVPVSIMLILLILLLLFNDWKKLVAIFICVPFMACGIIPTLLITGLPFTFMAVVGAMGLMGMIVKNAIVLMDEIGRLQAEGVSSRKAVVDAAVSRMNPVLMASLTTIAGMLPLLGDPMYGSMAACIMGGLAVGTIITLVLLPVVYSALFKIK